MLILGFVCLLGFGWIIFSFQFSGRNHYDGIIHFKNYVYCSNLIIGFPDWIVRVLFFNAKQTKLPLTLVVAQVMNYCMFAVLLFAKFCFKVSFDDFMFLAAIWAWIFIGNLLIMEIDHEVYKYRRTHIKGANKFSKTYKKREVKERIQRFLKAIQENDTNVLKAFFSKMTISLVDDFDQSIETIFDYCEGDFVSYKGPIEMNEKQVWNNGARQRIVDSMHDVKTDYAKYRFVIRDCVEDTENDEMVGIYSLCVFSLEDITDKQLLEIEERFNNMDDTLFKPGIHLGC